MIEEVEILARALCKSEGGDPGALVTPDILERTRRGEQVVRIDNLRPAWTGYAALAEVAIGVINKLNQFK